MRKLSYLTLFSIVFLFFSAIVTSLTGMIHFKSAWVPLIIAFAILILSTVLSVVCRDNLNGKSLFMTALNSIALGFAIRAWYIFRNINNPVWVLLPVALAASAYPTEKDQQKERISSKSLPISRLLLSYSVKHVGAIIDRPPAKGLLF